MLCYCKKCGKICHKVSSELNDPCTYCENKMYLVPNEYLDGVTNLIFGKNLEEKFINEHIKNSPEFDEKLCKKREYYTAQNSRINMRMKSQGQNQNIPHCPTCNSTNLKKISGLGTAAKIGMFGIFGAGNLGKTWKCRNCGSKW